MNAKTTRRKTKKFLAWILTCVTALTILSAMTVSAATVITPVEPQQIDGVYQIGTADELYWFSEYAREYLDAQDSSIKLDAVLTADIKVNDNVLNADGSLNTEEKDNFVSWKPIAGGDTGTFDNETYYVGTFDGQNHTISGIYCTEGSRRNDYAGLFGSTLNATIKNITLEDSYIGYSNGQHVGGIVGHVKGSTTIENCVNKATLYGAQIIGGIAGKVEKAIGSSTPRNGVNIKNCRNEGKVEAANDDCGGLIGIVGFGGEDSPYEKCIIENCMNTGSVSVGGSYGNNGDIEGIGGFIGEITTNFSELSVTIKNCGNTGKLTVKSTAPSGKTLKIGGFIGNIKGSYQQSCYATIENCYTNGEMNLSYTSVSTTRIGNFVGSTWGGAKTINCYYNKVLSDKDAYGYAVTYTNTKPNITFDASGMSEKSTDEFASGAVAYLLGENFGQNIDNGREKEESPMVGGAKVYKTATEGVYTNLLSGEAFTTTTDSGYYAESKDAEEADRSYSAVFNTQYSDVLDADCFYGMYLYMLNNSTGYNVKFTNVTDGLFNTVVNNMTKEDVVVAIPFMANDKGIVRIGESATLSLENTDKYLGKKPVESTEE